jgi:hypothetical protein
MKKTTHKAKLVLQKQTVRTLVEHDLKQAGAGADSTVTKEQGCPLGATPINQ